MAMSTKLSTLVCAAAIAAGCGANPNTPETLFPVTLTLQAGQTSMAGGLGVTFVEVTNDWRCPGDAICITAGDAYLKFLFAANNSLADVQLQVDHPQHRRASYRGYSIEVQALTPYPFASLGKIKPEDYKVTIRVSH